MTDELRAAYERVRPNEGPWNEYEMGRYNEAIALLANAYVELMESREAAREQCGFQAPTREWFEWIASQFRSNSQKAYASYELMKSDGFRDNTRGLAGMKLQESSTQLQAATTLESWIAKFDAAGAFDRDVAFARLLTAAELVAQQDTDGDDFSNIYDAIQQTNAAIAFAKTNAAGAFDK